MKKIEDWVKQDGTLTESGKNNLGQTRSVVLSLLSELQQSNASEQEIRMVGAILKNIVSTVISDILAEVRVKENAKNDLWKMSDEEFKIYLHEKYGEVGMHMMNKLEKNEEDRYSPIIQKELMDIMKNSVAKFKKTKRYGLIIR